MVKRGSYMSFESGVVPEEWSLSSVIGKMYAGILVDRVRLVTEGFR